MAYRQTNVTGRWKLVVDDSLGGPDGLMDVDREAIATAIVDGEDEGVITQSVAYDDEQVDPSALPGSDESGGLQR